MATTLLSAATDSSILAARTTITADLVAGATSATVRNPAGFAASDLLLLGSLGDEKAEIVTCSGVTGSTVGFSASAFTHSTGDPLAVTLWNRRKFYECATIGGTYTAVSGGTVQLAVDAPPITRLAYTGSNPWFKATYYHASTAAESPIGDAQPFPRTGTYTTLDEVRTYLGVGASDTSKDALLAQLLWAAEGAVNGYCTGDATVSLLSQSFTEYLDGGTSVLTVTHWPLVSVRLIEVGITDFTTVYDSTLADTANSVLVSHLDGGRIFLSGTPGQAPGLFLDPRPLTNRATVRVTYTAGFTSVPEDVKLAVWKLVARLAGEDARLHEGVYEYKIGSKQVKLRPTSGGQSRPSFLTEEVQVLLDAYRRT